MSASLVGSEMCIRDSSRSGPRRQREGCLRPGFAAVSGEALVWRVQVHASSCLAAPYQEGSCDVPGYCRGQHGP
eukprot:4754005-Alexandrium_andersonii.AAC.1